MMCACCADAPYELSPEFLHELLTRHRIDYVVHGDDPCLLPDGTDAYAVAKQLGRFKQIKRTEGVSSTDIVGRMLMCTRDNARFRQVGWPPFQLGGIRTALDASLGSDAHGYKAQVLS